MMKLFVCMISFICMLLVNSCVAGSAKPTDKQDEVIVEDSKVETITDAESDDFKVSLVVPDAIKKEVPKEAQYYVLFHSIAELIQTEHVKKFNKAQLVEKAVAGMISALDPHSSFLDEKAFTSLLNNTNGTFYGIGVEIMIDDSCILIVSPLDDTPAYKANIKSGDAIICINDEAVSGISAEEAVEKLRGKPGTKVKLKIKRKGMEPFDVNIVREAINVKSVKYETINDILYIRIASFDKNTVALLRQGILSIDKSKVHGIVIDIRNNPGGLLEQCILASNLFLEDGVIVSMRGRTKENSAVFRADPKKCIMKDLPLVVLVNNGTASAPEIFAAALKDHKRAMIVGVRTFGKGSVQKIFPLSDKCGIKLTIAKYYVSSGECIQANGVLPHIIAEEALITKLDRAFEIREETLPNALDAKKCAKYKKATDASNKEAIASIGKKKNLDDKIKDDVDTDVELLCRKLTLKERVQKDFQLNKAFDIIKNIQFLNSASKKNG